MPSHHPDDAAEQPRRATAFDIRVFVASLIGLYGIVLVLMGMFSSSTADLKKSDDVNINLFAGIGMVLLSAGFLLWARLRPVVVPGDGDDAGAST